MNMVEQFAEYDALRRARSVADVTRPMLETMNGPDYSFVQPMPLRMSERWRTTRFGLAEMGLDGGICRTETCRGSIFPVV